MRTSVNTRLAGGSLEEAISIGKTELPSFQEAYEMFSQTSRWLSPQVDPSGKVIVDASGRAMANAEQRGLNLYGVRLPGQGVRPGVNSSISQQQLAGVSSHEELMDKMKGYDITPGEEFNIYTLDIETTGLHPLSQTREISVLHRKAIWENGNLTYTQDINPDNVTTWHIKTNKMDAGATYETIGGIERPVSLSETAFMQTGAREGVDPKIYSWLKEPGPDGVIREDAETAIRQAFEMIMGQTAESNNLKTRFSLHNNNFDIGFMINNLLNMGDELKPGTVKVLKDFAEKRANDPNFVVDTIHSVTYTMMKQAYEQENILQRVGGINQEHVNKFLTDSLLDRSLMEKAEFTGQGAAFSSVENAILNTNLLSLIENDATNNPELLKALEKGTHTGKVDVIVQAYIEKSIAQDNLRIQRSLTQKQAIDTFGAEHGEQIFQDLHEAGFLRTNADGSMRALSQFEKHFRRKATRSSALTLSTNVKDVNLLSETGYKYLADTEEGMRRVSLDIEGGIHTNALGEETNLLEQLGLEHLGENFQGKLRFSQTQDKFHVTNVSNRDLPVDFQEKARSLVKSVLADARGGAQNDLIDLGNGSVPIATNRANNMLDIRMSHMEHTELTQMQAARQVRNPSTVRFNPNVDQEQLIESLTHTSVNYREKGKSLTRTVHYGDLLEDGTERTDSYVQKLQELNLPYTDISPASRVSAVETSRATQDVGKILWKAHAATLTGAEATTAKNISTHIEHLEEFGQTYIAGQGKSQVLGLLEETPKFNPEIYSRVPVQGAEQVVTNFIVPSSVLGKLQVDAIDDAGNKILEADGSVKKILIGSQDYLKQANHTVHYSLPSGIGQDNTVNLIFKHGFSEQAEMAKAESEDLVTQMLSHIVDLGEENFSRKSPITQIAQRMKDSEYAIDITNEQVGRLIKGQLGDIPENAQSLYGTIVTELGETLRGAGVIAFSATDAAGATLKETLQHTMPEIFFGQNTDVEAAKNPMKFVQFFGDMLGARLSPMKNEEAAIGLESLEGVANPQRAAQLAGLKMDEEATLALRGTANVLAESATDNANDLLKNLNLNKALEQGDKFKPFNIMAENMWAKNKGKVAIGAAVIGTALLARHLSKKHRENQQYESTMMLSEPEKGQRPYGAQEALLTPKAPQSNSDPLATAGVVGNLDRRKVGHTNMSPQKNAHLFRG